MLDKIKQFHIKHQYYVSVKPIPNMPGCITCFPQNLINNKLELNKTYLIDEANEEIEIYSQSCGKDITKKVIKTFKYGIRLLIMGDILLKSLDRGISRHLIVVEPPEKNLFELLRLSINKEELVLEKELCVNFRELLLGRINNDVKPEVVDCYRQIVKCFEQGEL